METLLLGETAAKCMDSIHERGFDDDAEMIAVGIVVMVRSGETTHARTFCSDLEYYRQIGLFTTALECVSDGGRGDDEDDDDEA